VIEKATKAGAKMSTADGRRLATILRNMTDENLSAYLTAVKGTRSPLATAVRTERDRRIAPKAPKEKEKVRLSIAEDRQKIDALSKELEDPQVYGNFERVQQIGKEVAELQAGIARKEAELGPTA
jgi:hypothetical protein